MTSNSNSKKTDEYNENTSIYNSGWYGDSELKALMKQKFDLNVEKKLAEEKLKEIEIKIKAHNIKRQFDVLYGYQFLDHHKDVRSNVHLFFTSEEKRDADIEFLDNTVKEKGIKLKNIPSIILSDHQLNRVDGSICCCGLEDIDQHLTNFITYIPEVHEIKL